MNDWYILNLTDTDKEYAYIIAEQEILEQELNLQLNEELIV